MNDMQSNDNSVWKSKEVTAALINSLTFVVIAVIVSIVFDQWDSNRETERIKHKYKYQLLEKVNKDAYEYYWSIRGYLDLKGTDNAYLKDRAQESLENNIRADFEMRCDARLAEVLFESENVSKSIWEFLTLVSVDEYDSLTAAAQENLIHEQLKMVHKINDSMIEEIFND